MADYVTCAHHDQVQVISSGGWVKLKCDGRTLFVPPRSGRGIVGVQLFGHTSSGLASVATQTVELRLVRRPEGGPPDQTGIDTRLLRARRRFGWVYAWTGTLDDPLTVELTVDRAAVAVENIAVKIDMIGEP